VRVPEAAKRALDVSQFKGALKSVATFADAATNTAIIEIERTGDVQGNVLIEGSRLVWSFDLTKAQSTFSPVARGIISGHGKVVTLTPETAIAVQPRIETSVRASDFGEVPTSDAVQVQTSGAPGEAGFTSTINAQAGAGRFNGRRIDLDLKDADIHNILRLLADVGRVNIVTADDVQGNITIRMRNVPWDQALDVVLQAKGLGWCAAET